MRLGISSRPHLSTAIPACWTRLAAARTKTSNARYAASRLSTKFVLITVALLTLSGGIGFFVGKTNLDSLTDLNQKAEAAAAGEIAVLEKQLVTSLTAEETLDIRLAEAVNAGALNQKSQDIETRKAFLHGKTEGALLIISSRLESILSPMPEEDREFFEANSDVYLEVLTDAKEINYFPAVDLESLEEVAADNELDPASMADFAKAIGDKARAETPVVEILADAGIIRFVSTIGPLENPFGVMEMVLDDSVTPLNAAAGKLEKTFAAELDARKKDLAGAFQERKMSLEKQKQAASQARAERIEEADTVGAGTQISLGFIVLVSTVSSAFVNRRHDQAGCQRSGDGNPGPRPPGRAWPHGRRQPSLPGERHRPQAPGGRTGARASH